MEESVGYNYGDDFPEALDDVTRGVTGRGTSHTVSPQEILAQLAEDFVHEPATRRKPAGGKMLAAGPGEKEEETARRKEVQKRTTTKILPKTKAEPTDIFLRRLDAHAEADGAIVVPMTPPEDNLAGTRCDLGEISVMNLGAARIPRGPARPLLSSCRLPARAGVTRVRYRRSDQAIRRGKEDLRPSGRDRAPQKLE